MKPFAGLVACLCCISLSNVAQSAQFIAGVENVRYVVAVEQPANDDARITHSWTAFRGDVIMNNNFSGRVQIGGIASTIEDGGTETNDDGFYFGLGITMNQNLDSGGGMIIDLGLALGQNDMPTGELSHTHTTAKFAYAFGEKGQAQPYFGYAFNTYTADWSFGATTVDYEQAGNHNFIVGVRAMNESFYGVMEATLGYELGVMLALEFGF
jgi:hypothetical protein